jgi:hypothetical protein
VPPVAPADAGLSVRVSVPAGGVAAGAPAPLTVRVTDAATGAPATDLVRTH